MLGIIAHHFACHGAFSFSLQSLEFNRLWIIFLWIWGKIGVNVFVLISGWFLSQTNNFKWSKIIILWLQMFFYSIVVYLLFLLFGNEVFTIKSLIKRIFPKI